MMRLLRCLPVFALCLAGLARAEAPATDPHITQLMETLGKTHSVSAVAIAPDARQLAWVQDVDGKPAIILADLDGQHPRRIGESSPGPCRQGDPAWSPDGSKLAFLSDCGTAAEGGKTMHTALFVVDRDHPRSPQRLTELPGYAHALQWAPDGHAIGLLFVAGATRRASALAAAKPAAGEIGVDGLEVQRVASVDLAHGSLQPLTPAAAYVYEFDWSPDSQRLAYIAAPAPGDNNWWIAKLYVQRAQAGVAAQLLVDPGNVSGPLHGLQIALPRWSPDGSRLAFIGGLMSDQGSTGGDIYAVPTNAPSNAPTNLTPGIRVTPAWFSWSDTQQLLVAQQHDGHSELARYAMDGEHATQAQLIFSAAASFGDGSAVMAVSLAHDGRHAAYVSSSFDTPGEVHAGDLASNNVLPAVTQLNAGLAPAWGKAESVTWDNQGFHVQGWLLYPANYDPHKRYPMIVVVHGGPGGGVTPNWPRVGFGAVPFSALGYFVLMPNPRGSFSGGEAFVQANRKDFGYGDLRDILAGVDAVEKKLPVDDARLGLTGWSYGGFMTMFAVTQTHRFHAAVAGAGIANWQSYYGENLIDQWMIPFFGASVYDDPAVYAKSSAIDFIKQVRTPTLVVVGDRDAECPAPQSFEFWHALRAQGVPTSLVVYPGEGHHFDAPEHQRDVLQRALNWFQHHLPATP